MCEYLARNASKYPLQAETIRGSRSGTQKLAAIEKLQEPPVEPLSCQIQALVMTTGCVASVVALAIPFLRMALCKAAVC
eukprot:3128105-Amphidinium_carterae.1